MKIEVSIGEILDKISILYIKIQNIKNKEKLTHIQKEYDMLTREIKDLEGSESFIKELIFINTKIWNIEDSIRKKEITKSFDEEFIELARGVYYNNDLRFDIKNKINNYYNSSYKEQKEYERYK